MKRTKAYLLILFTITANLLAHCDTMSGPVIPDARAALEKGDITPVLKWIKPDYETELKNAFDLTLKVRGKDKAATELADKYFLETLIRLHRTGEGAPYTGLKDTPPDKIITLSDDALAKGSADELIEKIKSHLASVINEKFKVALETAKDKDKSVQQGRKYVQAYVAYTHLVEGIHNAIISAASHDTAHAASKTQPPSAPAHEH